MAIENGGTGTVMPVAPMYGYGGGGGFGGFGGDWGWIILLLVLFGAGGFGGGWGGGDNLYPWMNSVLSTQGGFNQAATAASLAGIQTSITNGFGNAEVSACNRAMADLNRSFDSQTAITSGLTGISSQLAQCCCENRLATQGLQATILQENCADRAAIADALRDVIASQTAGVQRILDTMCQDKIDAKNERIADLERQLTAANLAASQAAQNAYLLSYIAPRPVPEAPAVTVAV